jgi:hypothetical protein
MRFYKASAANGHLTISLWLLTIQRLAPIDKLSIDPVFRQSLSQWCQWPYPRFSNFTLAAGGRLKIWV